MTKELESKVLGDYESYNYHTAVQKFIFCVNELGGIYLDIVKDNFIQLLKIRTPGSLVKQV